MTAPSKTAGSGSFFARFNAVLLAGLVLLVLLGGLAVSSVDQLVASAEEENLAQGRLTAVEEFVGKLERVGATVTRYLVEGTPARNAEYVVGKDAALAAFEALTAKVATDPAQTERLTRINKLMRLRFIEQDRLVRLIGERAPLPPPPDSWPYDTLGPARSANLDQSLADLLQAVRAEEVKRIEARRAEVQVRARQTSSMIAWGGVIALLLVGSAAWFANRYQRRQARADAQLRASEERVKKLIDSVPGLISYVDRRQTMQYHNRAYRDFLGRPAGALDGKPYLEVVDTEVARVIEPYVARALAGESVNFERTQRNAQGVLRVLACAFTPDFGARGEVLGYYALLFDVTERRELERLKSDFVAMVSHELRTPLTSIVGALALARDSEDMDAQIASLLEIAARNSERLARLVNDVLDLEKIEAGKMEFHHRPIDLGDLLAQAAAANQPYAETLGVRVRVNPSEDKVLAHADADRAMQVLTNLISNACKASGRGQEVVLSSAISGQMGRVAVRDHGRGIPVEFQPLVFEKFAQSATAKPIAQFAAHKGTGLGLPICKVLIEHMGGTIGFRTQTEGDETGTVFFFELPLA